MGIIWCDRSEKCTGETSDKGHAVKGLECHSKGLGFYFVKQKVVIREYLKRRVSLELFSGKIILIVGG